MYILRESSSWTLLHQNRKSSSRISLQNRLFCLCGLPAVANVERIWMLPAVCYRRWFLFLSPIKCFRQIVTLIWPLFFIIIWRKVNNVENQNVLFVFQYSGSHIGSPLHYSLVLIYIMYKGLQHTNIQILLIYFID